MFDFNVDLPREEFFAYLALGVTFVRYAIYLFAIYKKTAKPHVFSWLNWGLLVGLGTIAQYQSHGGPSVWVLTSVSATCFFIAAIALFAGEKQITKTDWIAFIGALIAMPVWYFSENLIATFALLIFIDCASYYPTIRKTWNDPWGEPIGSYFWAGLRYFLALFAVPDPNFTNLLYPLFLMAGDWGFVIYGFMRRKVIPKPADI